MHIRLVSVAVTVENVQHCLLINWMQGPEMTTLGRGWRFMHTHLQPTLRIELERERRRGEEDEKGHHSGPCFRIEQRRTCQRCRRPYGYSACGGFIRL
jgi:hypothetical protein